MRYRTLDVRLWGDERFRALSLLKPSGQALFLYLLTNPNTTSIPGLYRAGAAGMAEELGWTTEGFHEAFRSSLDRELIKVAQDVITSVHQKKENRFDYAQQRFPQTLWSKCHLKLAQSVTF